MAFTTYTTSNNTEEIVLTITLTEDSRIGILSLLSSTTQSYNKKDIYISYYMDGTNLTNTVYVGSFTTSFSSFTEGISSIVGQAFPAGAKLEIKVIQENVTALETITITTVIESGAAVNGINPVVGKEFDIDEGVVTINPGATEIIVLREYDGMFSVKSFMLDTTNKNLTVKVMYDINDSYRCVEEQVFTNVDRAFTWSSDLITKACRIEVTNNGSSPVDVDWSKVLTLY